MTDLLKLRLLLRFLALGVLTFCLITLSLNSSNMPLARTKALTSPSVQAKTPKIRSQIQTDAPLSISALRTVSWDGRYLEVAMELVNVSKKQIRAYAIKQSMEGQDQHVGQVVFTSLEANNKEPLKPNQLITDFDVYDAGPANEEQQVVFLIDYVEFSDGTKWGTDSAKFAEKSEGQRAAIHILSKRLFRILSTSNSAEVMSALEKGEANIEPPADRSDEWKEGFRVGCRSITSQLKRAQAQGGLSQVDREVRHFKEVFGEP